MGQLSRGIVGLVVGFTVDRFDHLLKKAAFTGQLNLAGVGFRQHLIEGPRSA